MTPETRARLFAAVPLYLWPYLWLQLWGLERWIRANKRDVLFAVSRHTGKVYITAISDAPAPEASDASVQFTCILPAPFSPDTS